MTDPKAPILFAEDSSDDRMLVERAFAKARFQVPFIFVEDGVEAVEYLTGKHKYADRRLHPLPCMLFTDLKMPRMGGLELLAWVRAHPQFKKLPVIIITGSDQPEDWQQGRELGANFFVTKEAVLCPPPDLFATIIRMAELARAGNLPGGQPKRATLR